MNLSSLFKNSVEGRNWVYVQTINGRFQKYRKWIGVFLIVLLAVLPWIRLRGMPVILFDIPHRKFVLFGTVFWPQDIWLLFFLGVAAGVTLFLATAWAGRVWCGYACPQSVFTEQIFLRIETLVEGSRLQRMKRDKGPHNVSYWNRKLIKHILFLIVSSLVGHTFVAYFMGGRELVEAILHPADEYRTALIFTTAFTLIFYLDFAFVREQFCNYMCPYARFQSALLDEESLVVGYDEVRGEPRGKKDGTGNGDCINCQKCVIVCPQGIDIRDGLQLECIHCARCADACDEVMQKVSKPQGLIRYDSLNGFKGNKARFWRPRTVIYVAILAITYGGFAVGLSNRPLIDATLLRQQGAPYVESGPGQVLNRFAVQVINKGTSEQNLYFGLLGLADAKLIAIANPSTIPPGKRVKLNAFILEQQSTDKNTSSNFSLSITATSGLDHPLILKGMFLRPSR